MHSGNRRKSCRARAVPSFAADKLDPLDRDNAQRIADLVDLLVRNGTCRPNLPAYANLSAPRVIVNLYRYTAARADYRAKIRILGLTQAKEGHGDGTNRKQSAKGDPQGGT